MSERVLCVDDDPNILAAYRRQLRQFSLQTALGPGEALEMVRTQGPFAVIISDMRMPQMNGVQFLSAVRALAPNTVRMMLTGNNDLYTAVDAINEGNIFRFLNKPCSPDRLAKAIEAGLEQYGLITAEKELLENTLQGSVKLLTDILSLTTPVAFGRASRIRRTVCDIAEKIKAEPLWQIELAAMLCQAGCVTVSPELLHKVYHNQPLTPEETRIFMAHPRVGSDLIKKIPRLAPIAEMILFQEKHFDGTGEPMDICRDLPLGSRILKIALDFDSLCAMELKPSEALLEMNRREGWYDPEILAVLAEVLLAAIPFETKSLTANELRPGILLAHDLKTTTGILLLSKGQEMTHSLCTCLKTLVARGAAIEEPIIALVPRCLHNTASPSLL
jgi:response regulator RpfG family c-di-GMP phosphodiesterase